MSFIRGTDFYRNDMLVLPYVSREVLFPDGNSSIVDTSRTPRTRGEASARANDRPPFCHAQ